MKILHVIPTLDPAAGGPPRIALRLAAATASLGHRVAMLYHASSASQPLLEQERSQVPGAEAIELRPIAPNSRVAELLGRGARSTLAGAMDEFDLVHAHSVWNGITRAAMTAAAARAKPFVLLANGMFDPWSMQQKWLKKRLALAMGMRRAIDRCAFIHVGNTAERDGVLALGLAAPIRIIPNGVFPQEFDPLPAAGQFLAAHPELGGRPYLLFLSRLHHKKGLDYLAGAFAAVAAEHPQLQLVVAGPDDGARAQFIAAVTAAGLTERVHVVGPLYGRERFDALVDAACFCLPSRQEGFSVAILEALACRTPVVISQACHFPEVAERGAGMVVPLEIPAIAMALRQIVAGGTALRRQMGDAGRAMVMTDYTWPTIARRMVEAYAAALARPPGAE
jgi:glycosyltransferase involved in cell wall biosynthesis